MAVVPLKPPLPGAHPHIICALSWLSPSPLSRQEDRRVNASSRQPRRLYKSFPP